MTSLIYMRCPMKLLFTKGLIEEVLRQALVANEALTFSLVYCDMDLYQPTRETLELIHPRLVKGGVFVFDEWNRETFPGEGLAVNSFLQELGDCYEVESIMRTRQPTLLIRKVRM